MTHASHKERGHGGEQNEMVGENFQPSGGVARAA
jgi:hypothetical protein